MNNSTTRFSYNPNDISISRSRIDLSHSIKTTFNAGELIPFFCEEVLPGDTFELKTSFLCRMATPVFPVMDNAFIDYYFFFVPNRLVWKHWPELNGENNSSYWAQPVEYQVPQVRAPYFSGNGWDVGSLADYFGLPINVTTSGDPLYDENFDINQEYSISALPGRAYVKIWNDWFRDQNVMSPAYCPDDDSDREGINFVDNPYNFENALQYAHLYYSPLPVSKFHDYFTSCLPAPQKGEAVGLTLDGDFPVVTKNKIYNPSDIPMTFVPSAGPFNEFRQLGLASPSSQSPDIFDQLCVNDIVETGEVSPDPVWPNNLFADAGNLSFLINDVRLAFQIQKLLERDARGGTRYIEIIKAHFGVDSPDERLQRSEYLGGKRVPINMSQVVQQSATVSGQSPIGTLSAFSQTSDSEGNFVKSFSEHGFIIGVCCVRTSHTYQQGIDRHMLKRRRYDYYLPVLANIGEQAVNLKELLFHGEDDKERNLYAFGYQEAWAEYRHHPNRVTGYMRHNVNGSLDSWHYADWFEENEEFGDYLGLTADFILETKKNIDRTLAVSSDLAHQFYADFWIEEYATRPMPLYSIPGLIDHN